MTRAILLVALPFLGPAVFAVPARAAERTVGIGSIERLRVDGPFEVRVAGGTSPSVRLTGERDAIDAVQIRQEGTTLLVRPSTDGWGERPRADSPRAVIVLIGTPSPTAVASIAGARITVTGLRGSRIDLSVTGAGAIVATGIAAADLNATVIGAGTIAAAGRTTRARLVASGPAGIDAGSLEANDATIRLEGVGTVRARARYTAQISNIGLGTVEVAGPAKCIVGGTGLVACEGPR